MVANVKKKRGLKVDKKLARRILEEEAVLVQSVPAPVLWKERVEHLSQVCEDAGVRSHIAVLGNAILAKATNLDIDPFSLKERDDSAGAYSARGIADRVLGPWASDVGLNIGVSGANPLNNQPFFHAVRVSERLEGVKGNARGALEELCAVLAEVSRIHDANNARKALRAFIEVRQGYSLAPPSYEFSAAVAIAPLRVLVGDIASFVAEDSEGGRRAQAAAAGLLDVLVGPQRVITRRINDPSRDSPGDIGISKLGSSELERTFEVRDKPVAAPDARRFIERVAAAKIERAGIISAGSGRSAMTPTLFDFGVDRGVVLEIFPTWESLAIQVAFWSTLAPTSLARMIHERIYERLVEIEAHADTLKRWQTIRSAAV